MKTESNIKTSKMPPSSASMRSTAAPGSLGYELTRFQNEIKVKQQAIDAAQREVTTLKTAVAAKDRLLSQTSDQFTKLQEKVTSTDGQLLAQSKELEMLKVLKRRADSQVSDLQRQNDKLREKVAALGSKVPAGSEQVAALQAEVKALKVQEGRLNDEIKALRTQARAKDKELFAAAAKLAKAEEQEERGRQLENSGAALARQLEETSARERALQQAQRQADLEAARLQREVERLGGALEVSRLDQQAAADALKVAEARAGELAGEMQLLRDELVRTSAVAARVAASEAKAGSKGDGLVPLGQHLEEVRYMQGEALRLRDRVAQLERELQVSDQLKDKLRAQLDAVLAGDTSSLSLSMRRLSLGSARGASPAQALRSRSARGATPSLTPSAKAPAPAAALEAKVAKVEQQQELEQALGSSAQPAPVVDQQPAAAAAAASPRLAPVLTRAPKEVTAAVGAQPIHPSSPLRSSSPSGAFVAKPVGPAMSPLGKGTGSAPGSPGAGDAPLPAAAAAAAAALVAGAEEALDVEAEQVQKAEPACSKAKRGGRRKAKAQQAPAAAEATGDQDNQDDQDAAAEDEPAAEKVPQRRQTRSRAKKAAAN